MRGSLQAWVSCATRASRSALASASSARTRRAAATPDKLRSSTARKAEKSGAARLRSVMRKAGDVTGGAPPAAAGPAQLQKRGYRARPASAGRPFVDGDAAVLAEAELLVEREAHRRGAEDAG